MMQLRLPVVFAALCGVLLLSASTYAQGRCFEGRTASGACVNAPLAATARQTAIIFAQPQISQTAFPILPVDDYSFRYPNNLIPDELRAFTGARPGGSK